MTKQPEKKSRHKFRTSHRLDQIRPMKESRIKQIRDLELRLRTSVKEKR